VVEVARRTETGEAPGDQGARSENMGDIRTTSNAERRDASPVDSNGEDAVQSRRAKGACQRAFACSETLTTGC